MNLELSKIEAIGKVNEDIIARVEGNRGGKTKSYTYSVIGNIDSFSVKAVEHVSYKSCEEIINSYIFSGTLNADIWDIFNDQTRFAVRTWTDLVHLNKKMMMTALKFVLLQESEIVLSEIRKITDNLHIVQSGLREVELLITSEHSRLMEFEIEAKNIQRSLLKLQSSVTLMRFEPTLNFDPCNLLSQEDIINLQSWYPGQWKVHYQSSVHGTKADTFHFNCSKKGPIVLIAKCNSGNVFGAYTSQALEYGERSDLSASLFTLKNSHRIVATKFDIATTKDGKNAVRLSTAGVVWGSNDLAIKFTTSTVSRMQVVSSFPKVYRDSTGIGSSLFSKWSGSPLLDVVVYRRKV